MCRTINCVCAHKREDLWREISHVNVISNFGDPNTWVEVLCIYTFVKVLTYLNRALLGT